MHDCIQTSLIIYKIVSIIIIFAGNVNVIFGGRDCAKCRKQHIFGVPLLYIFVQQLDHCSASRILYIKNYQNVCVIVSHISQICIYMLINVFARILYCDYVKLLLALLMLLFSYSVSSSLLKPSKQQGIYVYVVQVSILLSSNKPLRRPGFPSS